MRDDHIEESDFRIEQIDEEPVGSGIAVPAFFRKDGYKSAFDLLLEAATGVGYKQYSDAKKYVIEHAEIRDIYEGLMEELAEAIQAVNKVLRCTYAPNSTPVSMDDAIGNLFIELADIEVFKDALGIDCIPSDHNPKWIRWAKRLGYEAE